ncbi:nucleoid-associated protein [Pseudomonas aeruginosa]|nr:nucleoid-associated protein [Pseudomonas aeruginosa]
MPIRHAIVHLIDKKPDGNPATLHARQSELGDSQAMENLMADLNESYNAKPNKAWGLFQGESGAYPFSGWLNEYLDNGKDFVAFSVQAVEHLKLLMFWHLENVKYLCYAIQTFRSSGASKAA